MALAFVLLIEYLRSSALGRMFESSFPFQIDEQVLRAMASAFEQNSRIYRQDFDGEFLHLF